MISEHPYLPPEWCLRAWPDRELLFLGGSGRYAILALEPELVSLASIKGLEIPLNCPDSLSSLPFCQGYIGVLAYEGEDGSEVFRVPGALIFDRYKRRLYQTGGGGGRGRQVAALLRSAAACPPVPTEVSLELHPQGTTKDYLDMVVAAQAAIRRGEFYQINLLRYFTVAGTGEWDLELFLRAGVAFGLFCRWPNRKTVVSLSPERFVCFQGDRLRAQPIKGTGDLGTALLESRKDRAELNMIVDLMRNDLHRVCVAGSVKVLSSGHLYSLAHLLHLEACVEGRLRSQSFGDFIGKLCPAGSITGAPKVEVMKCIRAWEGRSRGMFMGNGFYWDRERGLFDSSVLIRTVWGQEYAAGSGIVLDSCAQAELEEIEMKCRGVKEGLCASYAL